MNNLSFFLFYKIDDSTSTQPTHKFMIIKKLAHVELYIDYLPLIQNNRDNKDWTRQSITVKQLWKDFNQ